MPACHAANSLYSERVLALEKKNPGSMDIQKLKPRTRIVAESATAMPPFSERLTALLLIFSAITRHPAALSSDRHHIRAAAGAIS
jgi:hypothetical protein